MEDTQNIFNFLMVMVSIIILGKKVYLEGLCDKCRIKAKANP